MQDFEDDDEGADGLEDLVDAIQVGDRSEGAAAVRKLMARAAPDPEVIARGVRTTIARDRARAEIQAGVLDIERRNPDLAKDPLLADIGMSALRGQMERDLRDLGATDEMLAPLAGNNRAVI